MVACDINAGILLGIRCYTHCMCAQYLPEDSIQTSAQEYLASHLANSFSPLEKEEKRACLYSVSPFVSVIPMQA